MKVASLTVSVPAQLAWCGEKPYIGAGITTTGTSPQRRAAAIAIA